MKITLLLFISILFSPNIFAANQPLYTDKTTSIEINLDFTDSNLLIYSTVSLKYHFKLVFDFEKNIAYYNTLNVATNTSQLNTFNLENSNTNTLKYLTSLNSNKDINAYRDSAQCSRSSVINALKRYQRAVNAGAGNDALIALMKEIRQLLDDWLGCLNLIPN